MLITRRLFAALPLATGAFACTDSVAPAAPGPSVAGVYALHTAAGAPPPSLIQHIVESETGVQMQVYVTSDTLELEANGQYQQRAQIEVRVGSTLINRARWADHGTYVLDHGAVHFESDYLQNVTFEGSAGANRVSVTQDLVGEGTTVEYVLRPTS